MSASRTAFVPCGVRTSFTGAKLASAAISTQRYSHATAPAIVRMASDRTEQAKQLAVTYGPAFLVTSMSTSAVSFTLWYFAVRAGVDVKSVISAFGDWLSTTPVGRPAVIDQISPSIGTFALAYIAHKASSPIRFPLVVLATPYIAGVIRRRAGIDKEQGQ